MLSLAIEKLHREFIQLSKNGRHFVGASSGRYFAPVGFNYDHDEHFRLLESYWQDEWDKVVEDFTSMRNLGGNCVRIHLQLNRFLSGPDQANEKELEQLDRLIALAASMDVYINLVGLCCYHSWEVPAWYNDMNAEERWSVQAFFWQTIAKRYANEPTIFCFDLMNEPVVPARKRPKGTWLGKEFAGKTYLQFITLDGTKQPRYEVARQWIKKMKGAIREHDEKHLITIGLVDWSLHTRPMKSGFFPDRIIDEVDFISTHLYPVKGKADEMLKILDGFCVGRPVVIDETFHLNCSVEEQTWFLSEAAKKAEGFLTFYTDYLPEDEDDGRNRIIYETRKIFKASRPLFRKIA